MDRLILLAKMFNHAKKPFLVWRVDFTVGKDLWPRIPRDKLSRFARIGYKTMQQVFDEKLGFKARFGMEISPQYWHSSAAGLGLYPHLHSVIPRLFVDEATGKLSTVDMLRLPIGRVKVLWRKNVEAVYGKSSSSFKSGSREMFSVRVRRYERVYPLIERLKYVYRGAIFDYEKYVNQGSDYSGWDREFVRWSLFSRHFRHIGYGLFAGLNLSAKSPFMRRIGLDYKTRMLREKERRKKWCPECGALVGGRMHDVALVHRKEAREKGLKQLKADFLAELKREADGRYVSY
ncbi:MAG: hypothetical protein LYZ70_05605 [Nitrososphaerales archaeon]|nr:hypothetical protein [Nitrososphaerales archaeon]